MLLLGCRKLTTVPVGVNHSDRSPRRPVCKNSKHGPPQLHPRPGPRCPVTEVGAPADWYPDPDGSGGQRYWDGTAWTPFRVPPPFVQVTPGGPWIPTSGWGSPPWKGARLGRPEHGPGALADPGRRLGARLLDVAVLLPVFVLLLGVALLVFGPRFGPIFPAETTSPANGRIPTPGFVWVYLTVFVCFVITGLVMVAYETVAVARFGRTLGMAWLHIRPLRVSGVGLGWGRSFGRAAIFWLAGFLGWIGLLDPLWCLWDSERQCLHDKVADSIVVNDS